MNFEDLHLKMLEILVCLSPSQMSLIRLFSPKHFDQQHQENQSIKSIII
jgi:hypothetical protein